LNTVDFSQITLSLLSTKARLAPSGQTSPVTTIPAEALA
jgi:hypothetical protein